MYKRYFSGFTKVPVLLIGLFIALALPLISLPDITKASTSNTRLDAWGTPEGDTSWYPGGGVQIYSNGSQAGVWNPTTQQYDSNYSGTYNCFTISGGGGGNGCGSGTVPTGIEWQCVELFNRFYMAKGWITSRWAGNGNTLKDLNPLPAGFSVELQGSITSVNPGDAITFSDGAPPTYSGHVVIVTSVSGSTVTVASQNTQGISWTVSWNSSTHTLAQTYLGSSYSPQAIIHHPGSINSGHLRQFYVSGSSWVAADPSAQSGVNIVGDPYEDSSGGTWARDTNNHLRQFYVSGSSWVAADITAQSGVAIASDVTNGPGGVFARDTNNHLRQFYVSGNSWVAADPSAQSGVSIAGNPFEDSNGGIWARDTNNHLRQFYVSGSSWVAADPSGATGVNILSDPSSGSQGILARDTNNHLRQFYVNNGWQAADITAQSGVSIAGNPFQDSSGGIWARDTNNHLRQFYVSGSSWVAADVTAQSGVAIASDVTNGSGGVFARDTNNHLRQFYVSGSSWVAADITAQSGVTTTGNPVQGSGGIFSNT